MRNIIFEEEQQFRQKWIWFLMFLIWVITLVSIFFTLDQSENQHPSFSDYMAIFSPVLFLSIVMALLYNLKLITRIDSSGIYYQFGFFIKRKINWDEITNAEVISYKPILQYGGWGIRWGWRNGWAYTVSGHDGLKIIKKNGSKILIGTQKAEELAVFLSNLNK